MLIPLWQIRSLLKTLLLNVKMGISFALANLQDNMKPYEGHCKCTLIVIMYNNMTVQGNAHIGDAFLWESTKKICDNIQGKTPN